MEGLLILVKVHFLMNESQFDLIQFVLKGPKSDLIHWTLANWEKKKKG